MPSTSSLTDQARSIWTAGVEAVRAPRLMRQAVQCDSRQLTIAGETHTWTELGRIIVVGAGKAGAGMAGAFEDILGPDLVDSRVTGWMNVPADCVLPLHRITLHPGRPAGLNEPTAEGLAGSTRILELVADLHPEDWCVVLLSGGGSALLPAPVEGISLADKQAVSRFLCAAGASINELNTVRKRLSRIKGGGLARAARNGRMTTLIISDVIGDPLDVIASGPTTFDPTTPQDALRILEKFHAAPPTVPQSIFEVLQTATNKPTETQGFEHVRNVVIGNNAVAMEAAAQRATELGYQVISLGSDNQGEAAKVGRELARRCLDLQRQHQQPVCLLSGGEPVVHLTKSDQPRRGGRNQQLALAALDELWTADLSRLVIASGGTDGEDGPTDAAGAFVDQDIRSRAEALGLQPRTFLDRCDAYNFFDPVGGLIKSGPTHTNVMDLRVALIG